MEKLGVGEEKSARSLLGPGGMADHAVCRSASLLSPLEALQRCNKIEDNKEDNKVQLIHNYNRHLESCRSYS